MSTAGPTPSEQANARLPALKGRSRFGSRIRSTANARNSTKRLDPYRMRSMEISRSKGSLSARAHASPQSSTLTHGTPRWLRRASTCRQHAVFCHCHGQASITHDQSIEHADAGNDAPGYHGQDPAAAPPIAIAAVIQSPVEKLVTDSPATAMATSGRI